MNIKPYFKRGIALLLLLTMLPVIPLGATESAPQPAYSTKLFEDFEGLQENDSYLIDQATVQSEDGKNKFLSVASQADEVELPFVLTMPVPGRICISLDLRLDEIPSSVALHITNNKNQKTVLATVSRDAELVLADGQTKIPLGKGSFRHLRFLLDSDSLTVFLDGEEKGSCQVEYGNLKGFYLTMEKANTRLSLDNIIIYSGKEISGRDNLVRAYMDNSTTISTVMKNAVVLYLNKSNILLHGFKSYLSEDRTVMPYTLNGKVMLPAAFFAESIGGTSSVNGSQMTVTVSSNTKVFDAVKGPGEALYVEAEALCEAFGKHLHIESNGLVVYSDEDMSEVLDWKNELKFMRKLVVNFAYDDISGAEMTSIIKEKYANQAHPRLILTNDKIAAVQKELNDPNGDKVYKQVWDTLKGLADGYLETEPSAYEIRDGIRLLYVCRENADRMMVCAAVYSITGEEKYAECAYETMKTCAEFPDWNPYHFLDVGTLANSMGLAYDWLYNWMDDAQRKVVRDAIVTHAVYPIMEDFDDLPRKRSWNWRGDLADNWCLVISGELVGGLAICDELEGYDLACTERAMEQTLIDIRRALMLFAPYGAYEEGPTYCNYTLLHYAYTTESMLSALGDDYGYIDVPGVKLNPQYYSMVNGSVDQFNYHDGADYASYYPPQMLFLAKHFGNESAAALRIQQIMTGKSENKGTDQYAGEVLSDLLLYSTEFADAEVKEDELNNYLPISEIATLRTGFDKNDIYVGFHCDDPVGGEGHDHMDVGTFVIDSQGERFIYELGKESYNIQNYYQAYRIRAEGHNTVVLNPEKHTQWDQKYGGTASITEFYSGVNGGYAIGDMTNAYYESDGVTSFLRGIRLDNDTSIITVQDQLRTDKPVDFWWFAHTTAFIQLSKDKKSALLTSPTGKRMIARIQNGGEDVVFSIRAAEPLPSSPPKVPGVQDNGNFRKLTVHIPNCESIDLCITFEAYSSDGRPDYTYTPLAEWQSVVDGGTVTPPTSGDDITTGDETDVSDETTADTDELPTTTEAASEEKKSVIGVIVAAAAVAVAGVVTGVILTKKKKRATL